MFIETIFVISGLIIAVLLMGKVWEGKRRKSFFLLSLISRGDERVRTLSHTATNRYTDLRERGEVFVKNELPLKSKAWASKTQALLKTRGEEFLGNIRATKLLRRKDDISEFFKNMSEMEREGRIDDTLVDPDKKDL